MPDEYAVRTRAGRRFAEKEDGVIPIHRLPIALLTAAEKVSESFSHFFSYSKDDYLVLHQNCQLC